MRFSLVYPTRHRPAFIEKALWFLEQQAYKDFEVIVSDNWVDAKLSCEAICKVSRLPNLRYVRPSRPLGMVENWNFALPFATGDYVCYFTDKMLLLPGTLTRAAECIGATDSDIVNWTDNGYYPENYPDYFGPGSYFEATPSVPEGSRFVSFDPMWELCNKGRAEVSRNQQDKSSYARGKICFGAYSASLCRRVVDRTGALFHRISPDYTSMIIGLAMARGAAEIGTPGIVHVHTDLSNGGQASINDEHALRFLNELGDLEQSLKGMLVPGLYAASHNVVSHDYLTLKERYGLQFDFDRANWLYHIAEDLDLPERRWSSKDIENSQRLLLRQAVEALRPDERKAFDRRINERSVARERAAAPPLSRRRRIRSLIPPTVTSLVKRIFLGARKAARPSHSYHFRIEDLLGVEAELNSARGRY